MILSVIAHIFSNLLELTRISRMSDHDKDPENLVLRYQLGIAVRRLNLTLKQDKNEKLTLAALATKFTKGFDDVFRSEEINIICTPVQAPNADAYADRFVRSLREECLNNLLALNESHLRNVLNEYLAYNIFRRPHQGLDQQWPIPQPPSKAIGRIVRQQVLGGITNSGLKVDR